MMDLYFDNEKIIDEESYEMTIDDKLSDSSGETEAGTMQYDYKRKDVHTINLEYVVTDKWLNKFSNYRSKDTILVSFYNELDAKMHSNVPMKIKDFNFKSLKKYKKRNLFNVTFTLEEI